MSISKDTVTALKPPPEVAMNLKQDRVLQCFKEIYFGRGFVKD